MTSAVVKRAAWLLLAVAVLAYLVSTAWAGKPVTVNSLVRLAVFALPIAGLYAISATGLVVVYKATGVFNLAQGAIGMVCAFVYWELSVRRGLPAAVAMVLVIGVAAPLFGVVLNRLLMQRLARSTLITQLLGTVGITSLLLGMAAWIWNPNSAYPIMGLGGSGGIHIAGILLTWHRIITIGLAVAIAGGLHYVLAFTRLGIAMRAVVDNEDLSSLYGIRPRRVSDTAWIIGSVCAAAAGILIAPEVGNMSAETLTFFVINSFAAAALGKLRSLPMTYVGAVLLGLCVTFTSIFLDLGGRWTQFRSILPAVALFIVLLLLPHEKLRLAQPVRRYAIETVPSMRSVLTGCGVLVVMSLAAGMFLSDVNVSRVTTGVMLAIVALGMVPLLGWAGLPFFAPYALAGVGAWATWALGGSVPALLGAAGLTAAVGVLISWPALRLRELYFALTSIAFGLIAATFLFLQPETFEIPRQLGRLSLAGFDLSRPQRFLVYACLVYVLIAVGLVVLRRSRFGRRTVALRDSEVATACVGISLARTKAEVFALAGAVSGIGGGIMVQGQRFVSADSFTMLGGLSVVLILTLFGIGTVSAPIVGGVMIAIMTALSQDWARGSITHGIELFGPALMVLLLTEFPRGQVLEMVKGAKQAPWLIVSQVAGLLTAVVICVTANVPGEIGLILSITGAVVGVSLYNLLNRQARSESPKPVGDDDWRLGVTIQITRERVRAWNLALGLGTAREGR